jgi:hypothetical protein
MTLGKPSVRVQAKEWFASMVSKATMIDEVGKWRVAAATFVSSIFVFHKALDAMLVKLWFFLQTSPHILARMFRHDHWEWILAVSAFVVYIHAFWAADRAVLKAGKQGRVHPLRKYWLHDRYEAQRFRREQLRRKERGENVVDLEAQPPLVTEQSEWNWKGWIFELPVYVVPLFIWDIMS